MNEKVIIFGASSAIAEHVARIYAQRKAELVLVGRSELKLQQLSADLQTRGAAKVQICVADLVALDTLPALVAQINGMLPNPDVALIAHGTLRDQSVCAANAADALKEIEANYSSPVVLLIELAKIFEAQKRGTIAVITSVAGDRGRKSNYTYGSAKGALSLYVQGLRNRLSNSGVHVCTIKPGFVDTPMTANLKKGPLFAAPGTVAAGIVKAIDRGCDIVYLPCFWRIIMSIIGSIPEFIFKRLSI